MQDTSTNTDTIPVDAQATKTAADRRREMRLLCEPSSVLIELPGNPEPGEPICGEIIDVSRSGVFLRMETPVVEGESVRASLPRMTIEGTVRYCRPNAEGTFDTGVEIRDVEYAANSDGR